MARRLPGALKLNRGISLVFVRGDREKRRTEASHSILFQATWRSCNVASSIFAIGIDHTSERQCDLLPLAGSGPVVFSAAASFSAAQDGIVASNQELVASRPPWSFWNQIYLRIVSFSSEFHCMCLRGT
jgi:hypothetical protein